MNWTTIGEATLENRHVVLRPLEATDRCALAEIAFEADIWRYFVSRIDDEAGLEVFMRSALDDRVAGRRAVFVVVDKRSNRTAGSMSYGNMAPADRRLEIGWSWLGKPFRGEGINGQAKLLLLATAFDVLGCERVEFKTDVLNTRARQGLRNIGATEEGVLRSYNYMPDGRRRDAIYYSILRAEWPSVRSRLEAGRPVAAVLR